MSLMQIISIRHPPFLHNYSTGKTKNCQLAPQVCPSLELTKNSREGEWKPGSLFFNNLDCEVM